MLLLRGILRVCAAIAALLFFYGITYAMEGMTTRLPISTIRELATTTLWMMPWMLLFCSGAEDLAAFTKRKWVFWLCPFLLLLFVYYCGRNTTDFATTKALWPLLACSAAILPHVFRRVLLVYTFVSILAAMAGIFLLYHSFTVYLSGSSFTGFAVVLVTLFILASVGAGILSVAPSDHFGHSANA